jgi:SH3-like domain-containing protein
LKSTGRGNVREGPGTKYDVAFSLDTGSSLTGHSYVDEWIRVSDESGRIGWIFRSLVTRR